MVRRTMLAWLWVLLLATFAVAQDEPQAAPSPDPAWERVLTAFRAKDEAAIAKVAGETRDDPWLTADELCGRGEGDAADAFARACRRKEFEKRPEYVGSRRAASSDEGQRKAFRAADAALRARKPQDALAAIDAASGGDAGIVSIRLLFARGHALRMLRRLDEAGESFESMQKGAGAIGWRRGACDAASALARLESQLGNTMLAVAHYGEAVDAARALADDRLLAALCTDAGNAHLAVGMLRQALELEEEALRLHTKLGDRAAAAGDSINIANVLLRTGRVDDALKRFHQGLADATAAGQRQFAANAMGNIGLVHWVRDEYEKAAEWIEKSRKAKEDLGDRKGVASSLANLAQVRLKQGRPADARALLEEAVGIMESLGDLGDAAQAHQALGVLHLQEGRAAEAVKSLQRALEILQPTKFLNRLYPLYLPLAEAYEKLGDRAKAARWYEEASTWVEGLGSPDEKKRIDEGLARLEALKSPKEREREREFGLEVRGEHVELAESKWKLAQEALAKDEKADAMSALRDAALSLSASGDDAGGPARQRLDGVFRAGVQLGMEVNDPGTVYYFLALRRARGLVHALLERGEHTPKYENQLIAMARARGHLTAAKAFVVYGVFEDETFAVVVTPKTASVARLGPTSVLAAACGKLALDDVSRDPAAAVAELRRLLVEPLALPETATRVMVSAPDEPLAHVPFALLLPDHEVASLASPEVAVALPVVREAGEERLVVGSAAAAEAWRGTRLDPATAKWTVISERLAAKPGRFFAVLANTVVRDPAGGGDAALEVAPDGDDRLVNASEIAAGDFPVRVVVLTGGDAARATFRPGEGVEGLPHAFLRAGANGVVASLWEPDPDAAGAFVSKFVESWGGADRTSKAAALRLAREHVRAQPRWRHPRYWAGWVLFGLLD